VKILHVVPTYLPATRYGGPIYSVHGLCRALVRRGHSVAVYTTNVDGPGESKVPIGRPTRMDGVWVTYFATGLGRRLYRSPDMAAALACNASDFDVVHAHSVFLWPTSAAASAARRAGVPYVVSPRGMLVPELVHRKSRLAKSAWIAAFERRNLAGAASVHMTADIEAEDFRRLRLRTRRIDVIPNGIELPADLPACAIGASVDSEKRPVVLSLGRINWKKGLDRLIRAIADVPQAELVIAGNDEDGLTPRLQELARQASVANRVRMIGPVHGEEKWRILASADVFALASYSENFGIAVLEAMACGVPVVVTPEVGLAAAVAETGAGIVVDGEPIRFGRALAGLLADPERRRRMGEAGRMAALERFSWNSVARQMEALYHQILVQPVEPHVVS
jgi:glycosyltransferase involved in cell wall biosynthesis